jgi:hypothetical protein
VIVNYLKVSLAHLYDLDVLPFHIKVKYGHGNNVISGEFSSISHLY